MPTPTPAPGRGPRNIARARSVRARRAYFHGGRGADRGVVGVGAAEDHAEGLDAPHLDLPAPAPPPPQLHHFHVPTPAPLHPPPNSTIPKFQPPGSGARDARRLPDGAAQGRTGLRLQTTATRRPHIPVYFLRNSQAMNRSGSDVPHRLEVADDGDEAAAHLLQRDVLGQPAAGRPGETPVRNPGQKPRLETPVRNAG